MNIESIHEFVFSSLKGQQIITNLITLIISIIYLTRVSTTIRSFLARWKIQRLQRQCNIQRNKLEQENGTTKSTSSEISGVFVYPVKSLRAVSLQSHSYNSHGFNYDRYLMIVKPNPVPNYGSFLPNDATHSFVTQRQIPFLARISCTLPNSTNNFKMILSCAVDGSDATEQVTIDVSNILNLDVIYMARVWDDIMAVLDVGDEAASFLQKVIPDLPDEYINIRVVAFHPTVTKRNVNPKFVPWTVYSNPMIKVPPPVAFADGYPILIACESSLDELNRRLTLKGKATIPMSRFRPNLVIKNTEPFEEDTWKIVQIGKHTIAHIVKGCPRCKQSCTDQVTGEVTDEPLETLAEFRKLNPDNNDVFFCQNAIIQNLGDKMNCVLNVGDKVRVLKRGEPVWG